jgi:hypothetical protein
VEPDWVSGGGPGGRIDVLDQDRPDGHFGGATRTHRTGTTHALRRQFSPNRAAEVIKHLILNGQGRLVTDFATPETANRSRISASSIACMRQQRFLHQGDPKKGFNWILTSTSWATYWGAGGGLEQGAVQPDLAGVIGKRRRPPVFANVTPPATVKNRLKVIGPGRFNLAANHSDHNISSFKAGSVVFALVPGPDFTVVLDRAPPVAPQAEKSTALTKVERSHMPNPCR